jgi:hypothetical protein
MSKQLHLIEHGASLKILPVSRSSAEQRIVYNQLMETCKIKIIEGQRVAFAQVVAELTDEFHPSRIRCAVSIRWSFIPSTSEVSDAARSVSDGSAPASGPPYGDMTALHHTGGRYPKGKQRSWILGRSTPKDFN